jgi:hypothetical protein
VDHVTSRELVCQPRGARIVPIPWLLASRALNPRMEHNQLKDAWIGAGVGAVAGASLKQRFPGNRGIFRRRRRRSGGALIGSSVPIFHHKQVIYKG